MADEVAIQPSLAPQATSNFLSNAQADQVWSDVNRAALIAELGTLSAHGLEPAHYHLARLKTDDLTAAERDQIATDAWMSAAAHMLSGKLDPVSLKPEWTADTRDADFATVLAYALATGTISGSLEQFAPIQSDYTLLKADLARLRQHSALPIARVSEGDPLKPGMESARARQVQVRLIEMGLLEADTLSGQMDDTTVSAVKALQAQEGLEEDGIVGAATLRALNRDDQTRIDQIRANMERWRWLPADLGRRHVRANIAGFDVTTYEDGVPQAIRAIIVGNPKRKTPIFSDQIDYIVFNPWWETPSSIARADKLPLFQKDPGAVKRQGFEIRDSAGRVVPPSSVDWKSYTASNFPYRIRQAPGPQNALGQVKIMFPNAHNVYLHDTPNRDLFSLKQRALSSGCVRTKDPIGLAEWLLSDTEGWDRAAIDQAVATGKETRADLAEPVPVHIVYFTAVPNGCGGVRYLDDIYERDSAVLTGLDTEPVALKSE
ncbi:L,D-transpeptidase family protein [uncultured Hyphomonas sp.]|uniref:L,D-transpeptidase family protein n=1 Tax=uncultured Hyphomonas sp. TaxID=225298 RepID=UPI0030DBAC9D|tara:strand:+ start:52756 stop:54225 length:1470 start_codon:yes stop_codon:yes gene_type:complete